MMTLQAPNPNNLLWRRTAVSAAAISLAFLSGCHVGPKYVAPAMPAPPEFKEAAPAAYANAPDGTWKPAQPNDAALKGKWWEAFNEPELNGLEDQVNINNQNIAQYFQNFMAARTLVRQAKSQYYPTVTTDPSYTRAHSPSTLRGANVASGGGATTGGTTTTAVSTSNGYTSTDLSLPIDISWEPDLWGRVSSAVHEQQYAAQVSAADLENERLTEQADLAEYYFELRGQDELQSIYAKTIDEDRKQLDLTQTLYDTGIDDQEAVEQAKVTLANAEEAAAGVAVNRNLYEHAIATLIGKPASSFSLPVKPLTTPVPGIPVGIPSQLLQRRPDIAAAERTMAEANALIGVEKAAYYPNLTLTGSGGVQSSEISTLFSVPALFWSVGSSLSETIFDAGLRRATVDQYTAQYNADVAAYKQTVLTAFQQVEDYTSTLRVTSQQMLKQNDAVAAAQRYVDLAKARYDTGMDPYLNVISAENTLLSDQQTVVTLHVNEMTAAVELVQALGGGWNVNQLPAPKDVTKASAATAVAAQPN